MLLGHQWLEVRAREWKGTKDIVPCEPCEAFQGHLQHSLGVGIAIV